MIATARGDWLAARDKRWPILELIWAQQHNTGDLEDEARTQYGIVLEVVRKPPKQGGFAILPRR
jgi:hypothetical protein